MSQKNNAVQEVLGRPISDWEAQFPLIADLRDLKETTWFNPQVKSAASALPDVGLTVADIDDAAARLKRFAPYLCEVFPDTRKTAGILESPLVAIPSAQIALGEHFAKACRAVCGQN